MLISKKFEGKERISRVGEAKELVITEGAKKGTSLVIDKDLKELRLEEGKGLHLLLERFAVEGVVKLDVIFVRGGVLVELKKGNIIADLGDNKYARVNKKEVTYIDGSELGDIRDYTWVDSDSLLRNAKVLVGHKYGVDDNNLKSIYVGNLGYNINISEGSGAWGLTIKFVNFYTDLGLEVFDFKVLKDTTSDISSAKPKRPYKKEKNIEEVEVDDSIIEKIVGIDNE